MDKLPILIVNFKTPEMVYYNILSIKKSTPNAKIYVFDNSDDGTIFVSPFDDVTVIDNTGDQIFDKWSGGGYEEGYGGSAMHAKTIQTCFDLIDGDGFVLLDSDVIVKKDLNELYDPNYVFVGEFENDRIAPYCCFINVRKCRENGVNFFESGCIDQEKDSGYFFRKKFQEIGLDFKYVPISNYISHFWCGSYRDVMVESGRFDKDETYEKFLIDNKEYIPYFGGLITKEDKCPVLIVNYNTKENEIEEEGFERQIIYYTVSSIRKHMPNNRIYIFENSLDEDRFDTYGFDNVTVIDNTQSQYFDRLSYLGSEMHARSVQAAMNIFSNIGINGFVLLDSDVIIKHDLNTICEPNCICVGSWNNNRIAPQCCFINTKICKENGLTFFTPNSIGVINGMWVDTGVKFANDFKEMGLPHKTITLDMFVSHYGGGSYRNFGFGKKNEIKFVDFLNDNRQYWE